MIPRRRALLRLGALALGLGVGLALAELLARLWALPGDVELLYQAPEAAPAGLFRTDPRLLMVPAPGFDGQARSLAGSVAVRTDALGLRVARRPAPLPQGPAWLAIGDSFTLALQVDAADSFSDRLSARIGQPVLNAGVDGYGTAQAEGRYRALAGELALSGLLLTFFLGNDLQDNAGFAERQRQARGLVPGRSIPRPPISALTRFLMGHSHLWVRWEHFRRARALAGPEAAHAAAWRAALLPFTAEGADQLAALLPATRQALADLSAAAGQRGHRLVVALAPPAFVVHPERMAATFSLVGLDPDRGRFDAPRQALLGLLRELGLQACDLSPALLGAVGDRPLYFPWDGHWTAAGHAVVAQRLAACIAEAP